MVQNMHIHSNYSFDSKMKLESIAKTLIENNVKYAGITDHVEFSMEPLPYVLTKLKVRNLEIDKLNEVYQGKLKLLKAVEISSPHLYKQEVEKLEELELDYIMGSIHKLKRNAKTKEEQQEVYNTYYNDMIEMIKAGNIDVIGHIDYIRKYYNNDLSNINQICEIMALLHDRNIVMEINSSASRRIGYGCFPSIEKIAIYSHYNSEVTIGTDAHAVEELTDNLELPYKYSEILNLTPVVFDKRKKLKI